MFAMGRRKMDDEEGPKWAGTQDEDARRLHKGLIDELRRDAEARGVAWKELLDRAELSTGTRSRVTNGFAGAPTIGKLRRVLEDLAATRVERDPESMAGAPTGGAKVRADERRRWVVVQCADRQLYLGITADRDEQVGDSHRVRLDRCRPVQSSDASPASLAAYGPGDRTTAGPEVPSALVLDVRVVYDATRAAIREFERRK
jgi:transcriptional regulator with XRE-family HTH domain